MNDLKILSSATEEEILLARHVLDLAGQALHSGRGRASSFLDERQLIICRAALSKEGYSDYEVAGGHANASRCVIVFRGYGDIMPFTPVVFNYREADKPSHRDFLGSLMALNIKREMIGDILVGDRRTVVFVLNQVLSIVSEVAKIGRTGVKVSLDFTEADIPEQEFEEVKATVQSLRLDAVLSSAIRFSREKTQELIRSKGVVLNHLTTFESSEKMSEGDVFSVKGFGKFILKEIGGVSKKDRIFIIIDKYK